MQACKVIYREKVAFKFTMKDFPSNLIVRIIVQHVAYYQLVSKRQD